MKRKNSDAPGSSNKKPKYNRRASALPKRNHLRFGEKKGMDTLLSGAVITTTNTSGGSFVVNQISPGTASFNRVGRKTYAQSLRILGNAVFQYIPEATTNNFFESILRMVVVWDKQPSGVKPNFDTIFGQTDQNGTETTNVLSPLRYDNMDRFRVLRDVRIRGEIDMNPNATGSANAVLRHYLIDEYIKLSQLESVYSGQTSPATIADISSGALYVYFRDTTATTPSGWDISGTTYARLRYTD